MITSKFVYLLEWNIMLSAFIISNSVSITISLFCSSISESAYLKIDRIIVTWIPLFNSSLPSTCEFYIFLFLRRIITFVETKNLLGLLLFLLLLWTITRITIRLLFFVVLEKRGHLRIWLIKLSNFIYQIWWNQESTKCNLATNSPSESLSLQKKMTFWCH